MCTQPPPPPHHLPHLKKQHPNNNGSCCSLPRMGFRMCTHPPPPPLPPITAAAVVCQEWESECAHIPPSPHPHPPPTKKKKEENKNGVPNDDKKPKHVILLLTCSSVIILRCCTYWTCSAEAWEWPAPWRFRFHRHADRWRLLATLPARPFPRCCHWRLPQRRCPSLRVCRCPAGIDALLDCSAPVQKKDNTVTLLSWPAWQQRWWALIGLWFAKRWSSKQLNKTHKEFKGEPNRKRFTKDAKPTGMAAETAGTDWSLIHKQMTIKTTEQNTQRV